MFSFNLYADDAIKEPQVVNLFDSVIKNLLASAFYLLHRPTFVDDRDALRSSI